jgi:A/G-specific adenine glycosylase
MNLKKLEKWFLSHKRTFSFRENKTFYRVWISEVMLQQTQAEVVQNYFLKWMDQFPTITDLAKASLDQVIKCWEGLGYYSRARNIHKTAQILKQTSLLPSSRKELLKLPGIGFYTSEALLSFVFHQKAYPVDGNVLRIFSRLFLLKSDIKSSELKKEVFELARKVYPAKNNHVIAEAFIELGALVCKKRPLCHLCPFNQECKAYLQNQTDQYPVSLKKNKTIYLQRSVFIIEHDGYLLVKKENQQKLFLHLYQLPYLDQLCASKKEMLSHLLNHFSIQATFNQQLPMVFQTFTCYKVELTPYHVKVREKKEIQGYRWVKCVELFSLPFSSGHKKILRNFINGKNSTFRSFKFVGRARNTPFTGSDGDAQKGS